MTGVTGSYVHMAPEVYSKASPDGSYSYDEKADIFSAAVLFSVPPGSGPGSVQQGFA